MDLFEAEVLAKKLIFIHVPHPVVFEWMRKKNAYGDYSYALRRLRLSSVLTPFCTVEETTNTIMHEIAHALTPGDNHGRKWQFQMWMFGLNSERSSTIVADTTVLAKWKGVCPKGHEVGTWMRKPRVRRSCNKCAVKFDSRYEIVYVSV